jgi:DNA-binding transcriptional regulator YdaS (Cro superfamily)
MENKMQNILMMKIIKHYGSQRKLAKALGVTEGSVSHWVKAGYFPPAQAIRIERSMGNSAFRAVYLVAPYKEGA